jgi:[acyl-carrier-protein] S-malonyltransferase
VLAGTPEGVDVASASMKKNGAKKIVALNVGGAFHTPMMDEARATLLEENAALPVRAARAPVVSNADAQPYVDGEGWPTRLADHLVSPVLWRSSMETLAKLGADSFIEIGGGGMIAGLAKRAVPDVEVTGVAGPDDVAGLARMAGDGPKGETLSISERLVVSPATGVFQPLSPATVTTEGEVVNEGQHMGTVVLVGEQVPVHSPFAGFLMGILARPGERVRKGQPVAWLRAF